MQEIAVLGAGPWGTALSLLLARKGRSVRLWVYDSSQAEVMLRARENPFMPGYELPDNIGVTTSVPVAVAGADVVLFAVRSEGAADVALHLKEALAAGTPVVSGTKGLVGKEGVTMSRMLASVLGSANPVLAISGPNIAVEIAAGTPTATVIASMHDDIARKVQNLLMCPSLRVYTNPDIIGVELAGALKNIIAIAAGICDGMGFGDNTKAALLTRGLAEITRLGVRMGARPETFMGLAGIGDLMVTCASPLSRNHRAGIGLGQGKSLEEVLVEIGQVAEGVPTTRAAYDLARRHDTPMPITEKVHQVLFDNKPPRQAVTELMTREPRDEVW